jgi:hypothetical protein
VSGRREGVEERLKKTQDVRHTCQWWRRRKGQGQNGPSVEIKIENAKENPEIPKKCWKSF